MSDKELLSAISNIVSLQIEPLKQDIDSMKQDIDSMKQDIKSTRIILENNVLPRLQTIEACYTSTYNRYVCETEDIQTMKSDIKVLKKVVAEHSEKLQKIG